MKAKRRTSPVAVAMRKRFGQTTTTHADKRDKQALDWVTESNEETLSDEDRDHCQWRI